MPEQLFYTAITRQTDDGYEVATEKIGDVTYVYAEHFVDEAEMRKRARQFEAQARQMDAAGDRKYLACSGTEPPEALIVRLTTLPTDAETPKEGDDKDAAELKRMAYADRVDALAAKAGAKTVSRLTAPEVDDSQEARPVPALALARSAVEVAEQMVRDAQDGVDVAQAKFDAVAAEFLSTSPDKLPEAGALRDAVAKADANDTRQMLFFGKEQYTPPADRRRMIEAQFHLDQEGGRLYRAESELQTRRECVAVLEKEEKENSHA